jgi:hypothetical protein
VTPRVWNVLCELRDAGADAVVVTRGYLPNAYGRVLEMSGDAQRGHIVVDDDATTSNVPCHLITNAWAAPE